MTFIIRCTAKSYILTHTPHIKYLSITHSNKHVHGFTEHVFYTAMATLSASVCRLCMSKVSKNHYCLLFSPGALHKKLSSRLGGLLEMNVDAKDGLPSLICEKCKRRFETLEKSVHDLAEFRQMAQDSFVVLSARGNLKRKECSLQTGVSSDIARSRPPLKRMTIRRLQYNSKHHKYKNNHNNILILRKFRQ